MTLNVDTIYTAAVADEQHSLAEEAGNGVFKTLAESTSTFGDRETWEAQVRVFEDEYMQNTQSGNPDAKTKGRGKAAVGSRWKYAKYMPKSWSSAKSVCGAALEYGIKIDADSGKSATEEAIKEAKNDLKTEKTPREKFAIAMDTARKVLSSIPDDERADVLHGYGIDPTNINWSNVQ